MRNIHVKMLTIPSSFPSSETQILHEQLQERSLLSTQVCLELVLWHKCEPELMLVHTGPFVVHQFALFSLHPFSSAIPSNHYDVQPLFFRLFSPCFHFPIIQSRKCCWQANLHKNRRIPLEFQSLHITLLCEQSEGEPVTISIVTSMSIYWCLQRNSVLQEEGEGH